MFLKNLGMKNVCFYTSLSIIHNHNHLCEIVDISFELKCHRLQFCVSAIKNHHNKGKQLNFLSLKDI